MLDHHDRNHLMDLDEPLRAAVCQLRAKSPTAEDVASVTRRSRSLARRAVDCRPPVLQLPAAIGMMAATATIALVVSLFIWPGHSWAEVVQALESKAWIRMRWEDPSGVENVTWVSLSRDVSARQIGAERYFDDFRVGTRHEYHPGQSGDGERVVRRPLPEGFDEDFQSFESQLLRIASGKVPSGSPSSDGELVSQGQRRVVEDGRTWIEYELATRRRVPELSVQMVFRVDPDTNLPAQWRIVTTRGDQSETVEMQLDYPHESEGPRDIYSLGVSRDTQLVDLVPDSDVSRILRGIDASIERFGDFKAIVAETYGDESLLDAAPNLRVVWRKGNQWRIGLASLKKTPPEADSPTGKQFTTEFWLKQLEYYDIKPTHICDGNAIYRNKALGDETPEWERLWNVDSKRDVFENVAAAAQVRPDFFGYRHTRRLARRGRPETRQDDELGLPGSVFLKSNDVKFWIDPARSHVSLKYEYQTGDRTHRVVNERFDQTPAGVWYSTLTRTEDVGDGDPWRRWFFVDFDAELPDELFSP